MKLDTIKIVGGHGNRRERDFYPTPADVTRALVDFLNLPRGTVIWEPACGDGAMTRVFEQEGYRAIGTDITTGTDFLTAEKPESAEWIITNPPFFLAEAFIEKAREAGLPFALLLKCQYWQTKSRQPLFEKIKPAYVLPLTWRPSFTPGVKSGAVMDFIWTVWGRESATITQYIPLKRPGKQEL